MSRLPDPIREALADELDEASIARLWRGTRERLSARRGGALGRPWALVLVGSAAVAAVALLAWPRASTPGPLTRAGGEAVQSVRTEAQSERIELVDGSSIELGPRSALAVRANDGRRIHTALSRGRARFTVTPGTGRRWTVDCGVARVEVVGTVFTLEHRREGLWVEVEHGRVRVHVGSGSMELGAGEHRLVDAPAPRNDPAPGAASAPPPVSEPEPPPEPAAVVAPRRTPRAPEPWRVLAERGAHEEAYRALGPTGIDARVSGATARELLLMADVARLSGHPADAVPPLERLLAEHPGDPQAPLAAVTLGRLEMDTLRRPARAVAALERAVTLGVPAALAEDVSGRLAIARLTSGDARGEAEARRYLAAHPEGRHAERLRALLSR